MASRENAPVFVEVLVTIYDSRYAQEKSDELCLSPFLSAIESKKHHEASVPSPHRAKVT